MNNPLMASLGLDAVEADPNNIPDGRYDGEVFKSEYVISENKDSISHVITYRVTDGDYKGAQRQQWYQIGTEPRDAQGNFTKRVNEVANFKPTMSDSQKSWYKKLFIDLGIPEQMVSQATPEMLQGKQVTFGVKRNNGFINVNFVELRQEEAPQAVSLDASPGLGGNIGF